MPLCVSIVHHGTEVGLRVGLADDAGLEKLMFFFKKRFLWEIVFVCSYLSVGAAPGVGQGELVEEGGAVAAVSQVVRGPV